MKSKQDFLTAKESLGISRADVLQTDPFPVRAQAAAGHSDKDLQCVCVDVCLSLDFVLNYTAEMSSRASATAGPVTCVLMRTDTLKAASDSN